MKKPKVSIILPVYNSCDYVCDMLQAIIDQTYENIELLIINDGSTDASKAKIEEFFVNKLLPAQFTYCLLTKENGGLNSSINYGLKKATGKYLTWMDPDDKMFENSIQSRVAFLEKNLEVAAVGSDTAVVDFQSGKYLYQIENFIPKDLVANLIIQKDLSLVPGSYLVCRNKLMSVLNHGKINEGYRGQNWPLLIPLALNFKFGFIKQNMHIVRKRDGSMSDDVSYDDKLFRVHEHRDLLLSTLETCTESEKLRYQNVIWLKYENDKLMTAISGNKGFHSIRFYLEMKDKSIKHAFLVVFAVLKVIPIIRILRNRLKLLF